MFVALAVNFLSAFWFALRIWRESRASLMKSVGFLTITAGSFCARSQVLLGMSIIAMPILIFFAQQARANWHREHSRRRIESEFLDAMILEMRAGRSFRAALSELSSVARGSEFALCLREARVVAEIAQIERVSHQALERLLLWRRRIRLESDFRRRFGQVSAQVRAQGLVIALLFAAIFIFNLRRGAWLHDSTAMMTSVALFGLGLVLIFRLGGRVKWNF